MTIVTGHQLPGDTGTPTPLTSGQVADMLGVDPRTIARWAESGRLPFTRTLGGHRRYQAADVDRLLLEMLATQRGLTVDELVSAPSAATAAVL